MAQRILGLDIGSWSIKAMVVESSLRRSSLVAYRAHPLPLDATGQPLDGELKSALTATLQGIEYDSVASAVAARQVMTRELELPFADAKRISQVLSFQLESVIPRDLDGLTYDYQLLEKTPEGARLMCATIDKGWMQEWLDALRSAGVDPRTVTINAVTAENLLAHIDMAPHADKDDCVAVIDLGHRASTVTVVKGQRMAAFRTVARGGHHITLELARALELNYADAEAIKHRQVTVDPVALAERDDPHARRYATIASRCVDALLRDLTLSLDALAQDTGPIKHIVLVGGTARLDGLAMAISRATGISVEAARPGATLWTPEVTADPEVGTDGFLAAALALEPLSSDDRHRINLRKGEFAYGSDFDAIRSKISWIAAFVALLLVAHFARQIVAINVLSKQEDKLGERLDAHMEALLGEPGFGAGAPVSERFATALQLVEAPPVDETRQLYPGITAYHAFYLATKAQHEVNEGALPDEIFDDEGNVSDDRPPIAELRQVELQSFNTDGKSVTITGTGFDINVIEAFKAKLEKVDCFKQVERQDTRMTSNRDRPNWRDFTLKAELRCERPSQERTAERGDNR